MDPRFVLPLAVLGLGLSGGSTAGALPLLQPDLLVESLSVGSTFPRAGTEVDVIYVVGNLGPGVSEGSHTCVGLATSTGEPIFVEPAGVFLPPVPAGTRLDDRRRFSLPRVPPGLYRLFAVADCGGEIAETDESNNRLETGIIVGAAPLIILTTEMPVAIIEREYCDGFSPRLEASGGEPPYRWKLPLDRLPPGLRLADDGLICGVPTMLGAFRFVAVVSDSASEESAPAQISIEVVPDTPHLDRFKLPQGLVFEPYRFALSARGGRAPRRFFAEGSLPPGISLSAEGVIEGTPTASGAFGFVIRVVDQDGAKDERSAELVVVELASPKLLETVGAVGCGCSGVGRGPEPWAALLALTWLGARRILRPRRPPGDRR